MDGQGWQAARGRVIAYVSPGAESPAPTYLKNEAELYLQEPPPAMDTDVLVWWGFNEARFPYVARMAAQFLGCLATSASAKRIFSLAGALVNGDSTNMNAATLEERMWAKINTGKRRKLK